jgi:hypothetical protein
MLIRTLAVRYHAKEATVPPDRSRDERIRLICDLDLNFRVLGGDLIAPRAFRTIERGVCGRKCIFLCIQRRG